MPASGIALSELLSNAYAARRGLLARCASEGTNAYRLFHGSAEG